MWLTKKVIRGYQWGKKTSRDIKQNIKIMKKSMN